MLGEPLPDQEHLADAIDAEVPADPALVAGGAIDHDILQLLSKILIRGLAVQLTGVHWGPNKRAISDSRGRSYRGHQEDASVTHIHGRLEAPAVLVAICKAADWGAGGAAAPGHSGTAQAWGGDWASSCITG